MKILQNNSGDCTLSDIQTKCFSKLLPEEADLVKSSKTTIVFDKGETILKQGVFSSQIAFVLQGVVKLCVESSTTKKMSIKLLEPGYFVGLPSVFSGSTYPYSASAVTQVVCCMIENDALLKLMLQNNSFAISVMTKHFSSMDGVLLRTANVVYKQMHGRLADTLLYINEVKHEGLSVFPHLSRRDLADFSGMSLESTVKILKSFEADKLIQLVGKDIIILKHNQLKEIGANG